MDFQCSILKRILLLSTVLFLTACSISGELQDLRKKNDFINSTFTVINGPGVPDNNTVLIATVTLRNGDHSVVVGHTPTIVQTGGGAGLTFLNCTPSDNLGVSTCTFKGSQVAIYQVNVTNIIINLTGQLEFKTPESTKIGILAGAAPNATGSGYKASLSIGVPTSQIKTTGSGYKGSHNISGQLLSQ